MIEYRKGETEDEARKRLNSHTFTAVRTVNSAWHIWRNAWDARGEWEASKAKGDYGKEEKEEV